MVSSHRLRVMSLVVLIILTTFMPLSAKDGVVDNLIHRKIVFERLKRNYYVHAPPGYDPGKRIPLVLLFHRENQKAADFAVLTGFNTISDRYNFLAVYPQAVKGTWNDGRKINWSHTYDDVGFVKKLIEHLEQTWNIDRSKVYAAGYGNGGFFTQKLALDLPEQFAAVSSVAATLPKIVVSKRKAHEPISILLILGKSDPIVPFDGGYIGSGKFKKHRGLVVSASETVKFWVDENRCSSRYKQGDWPDVDPTDECRVKWLQYSDCPKDSEVVVFAVIGGGHCWPGARVDQSKRKYGVMCRDLDASMEIWRFFAKHQVAGLR